MFNVGGLTYFPLLHLKEGNITQMNIKSMHGKAPRRRFTCVIRGMIFMHPAIMERYECWFNFPDAMHSSCCYIYLYHFNISLLGILLFFSTKCKPFYGLCKLQNQIHVLDMSGVKVQSKVALNFLYDIMCKVANLCLQYEIVLVCDLGLLDTSWQVLGKL